MSPPHLGNDVLKSVTLWPVQYPAPSSLLLIGAAAELCQFTLLQMGNYTAVSVMVESGRNEKS